MNIHEDQHHHYSAVCKHIIILLHVEYRYLIHCATSIHLLVSGPSVDYSEPFFWEGGLQSPENLARFLDLILAS